jgi:hypothetical protein
VGESAENLSAVDPVLGEVDRLWWLSLGLSWCELAEGTVPGSVIVLQVFGQRPSQVVLQSPASTVIRPVASIAADLSAWCRLPGLYDYDDLRDAEPDTQDGCGTCPPGWPATPALAC